MALTQFFPLLWWALAAACAVGGGVYLYVEYQAYLLRTSVSSVPGGLRFQSRGFSVETRTSAKQLAVQTKGGDYTRQPLAGGDALGQTGAQTVILDVVGLRLEVFRVMGTLEGDAAPKETGFSTLVFKASDALAQTASGGSGGYRSTLRLDLVPDSIALEFQGYANGVHDWIGKLEGRLNADIQAKREREDAAAQVVAAAAAAAQRAEKADKEAQAKAAAAAAVIPAPADPDEALGGKYGAFQFNESPGSAQ